MDSIIVFGFGLADGWILWTLFLDYIAFTFLSFPLVAHAVQFQPIRWAHASYDLVMLKRTIDQKAV